MFCPDCGYEYREGFSRCPDCNVDLVSTPDKKKHSPGYKDFVEVLDTPDILYVRMVASVLESVGIETYILGEHFGGVYAGAFAVKLMARSDRADEALEIIEQMDKERKGPPSFDYDNDYSGPDDGEYKGFYDDGIPPFAEDE